MAFALPALPAILGGIAEAAPTIMAGISSLGTASALFDKYKPSSKTINSIISSKGRKSVGSFFKSLASPKGAMRLVSSGLNALTSGDLINKALGVAQDVSSVIGQLENLGISNDYTKQAASQISGVIGKASSLNDQIKSSPYSAAYQQLRTRPAQLSIPIESLPVEIQQELESAAISMPRKKKKKVTKNKINMSRNERARTYR